MLMETNTNKNPSKTKSNLLFNDNCGHVGYWEWKNDDVAGKIVMS
jgi:hypothetical protein